MLSTSSTTPPSGPTESDAISAERGDLAERVRRGLPIELPADEQASARELVRAIKDGSFGTSASHQYVLPPTLREVLLSAVETMARGDAVSFVPTDKLLSTQEAADMLDVSRQYLVRLLDGGQMPQTRTGTHRRVALSDVLRFKEKRDRERQIGLRELTQMSLDAGGYKELKRFR